MNHANDNGDGWQFWIDVGGTFTDCIARRPDGTLRTHKLLSSGVYKGHVGEGSTRECVVDPGRRGDPTGLFVGWKLRLLRTADSQATPKAEPGPTHMQLIGEALVRRFDASDGLLELDESLGTQPRPGDRYELRCDAESPLIGIHYLLGTPLNEAVGSAHVRLGTTRGTNALLERRGAPTAFVTTAGFGDVLRIGTQQRPRLFDLHVRKPASLNSAVVEIEERVGADGVILSPLDEDAARRKLLALRAGDTRAIAICLLNSYRNDAHERRLAEIAGEIGFEHVSVSSHLLPLQRIVPRGETTVVNAYLTPIIGAYLRSLREALPDAALKLMTSAGGLIDAEAFVAKDSILSGPAAGVVGAAHVARAAGFEQAIGFDMGGTSTDVSRYAGEFERRHEMELEDSASGGAVRVVAPMLAIETVAAGGGSICDFDGIKPTVGPRSAGANPGPACYGAGGPLCVTDVNLYLGRVPADLFPFPLDRDAVERRLRELIERIAEATGRRYDAYELAAGYVAIANAHMAAAIKKISVQRGYDPREDVLVSFGGAGGQHACAIARELGIRRILAHPYAGVLSAYGIGMADVMRFAARDVGKPLSDGTLAALEPVFAELDESLRGEVRAEGIAPEHIPPGRRLLDLRYVGQDATITVAEPDGGAWRDAFERQHRQLYGFTHPEREIEVYAARLEVTGHTPKPEVAACESRVAAGEALRRDEAWFDGAAVATPICRRAELRVGERYDGPAIILEATSTIVVEPGWEAEISARGDIVLAVADASAESCGMGRIPEITGETPVPPLGQQPPPACDPITLELYNHQFAAVAEQMGATLQRTALSTNIKERLDFSCAIYDAGGGLVAHAAHIPVHIGAMGHCVEHLIESRGAANIRPGEVYVTNDPYHGGSHLPDVTVITPVFDDAGHEVLFYAANRAHHSEIGGIAAGSMSPLSRNLAEEGVCIPLMPLVVRQGESVGGTLRIQDDALRELLTGAPYPSRAVEQNLADVRGQVAANQCGVRLLAELVARRGLAHVRAYMGHIQRAAETKMRRAISRLPGGRHEFTDHLDDGTPVVVSVTVRGEEATLDFAGTGPVRPGNLNATPAIVASAVLYCFRCLIDEDIPLNAGALVPLKIVLPECMLNPPVREELSQCAAVAGGNVETSQRIVDCIFGTLGVVAASQGTMNNFTFGNERFGYYETIAGGAGAGSDFDGCDAVHTHMTNTRLTDPEVLEHRYPVRLRRFAIRRGSGGGGRHRGGDGVVREFEFLEALDIALVTQRREYSPYGVDGGESGRLGCNTIIRRDGTSESLGAVAQVRVDAGDVLRIETPGGGGFGRM